MRFTVEYGFPIQKPAIGRPTKYPFRAMKIGESFFVAIDKDDYYEKTSIIRKCARAVGAKASCRAAEENGVTGARVRRVG